MLICAPVVVVTVAVDDVVSKISLVNSGHDVVTTPAVDGP